MKESLIELYRLLTQTEYPDIQANAATIRRELIDWLKQHPEMCLSIFSWSEICYFTEGDGPDPSLDPLFSLTPIYLFTRLRGGTHTLAQPLLKLLLDFTQATETQAVESFGDFIRGLSVVYGIVTLKDAENIYQHISPLAKSYDFSYLLHKNLRASWMFMIESEDHETMIIHPAVHDVLEILESREFMQVFSWDALVSYGQEGWDVSIDAFLNLKQTAQELEEDPAALLALCAELLLRCNIFKFAQQPDLCLAELMQHYPFPERLKTAMYEALYHYPIWIFGGFSYADQADELENMPVLTDEMIEPFFMLIDQLFYYSVHQINPSKQRAKTKNFRFTFDEEKSFAILEDYADNPQKINDFVISSSHTWSPVQKTLLTGFRNMLNIKLAIAKDYDEDGYLEVVDPATASCYHVCGLSRPITDFIHPDELPLMIQIMLVPLPDTITYALHIRRYARILPNHIEDMMLNEYDTYKHIRQISELPNYRPLTFISKTTRPN